MTSFIPPKYAAGDCLDILKTWPDACVDLVFTSPPYSARRTYSIGFKLSGQAWVDWTKERFLECLRVSRGLVAFVVQGPTANFRWSATPALLMADLHRAGVRLRDCAFYHRIGIPGSGGPDWLRHDVEYVVCASKGRLPWSDNTVMGHPPKWGPGGEMSYRVTDGTRVNQWGGHERSSGYRQADGTMREPGRPSHKIHTKREASGEM
jgi:hypothetical protein